MRLRQCLIVSRLGTSLVYRLTSARAHHLASGDHVRDTSLIAICEVAGMRREITVRTAYYGSNQGKSYWSNGFSRGTSIPTMSLILRVTNVIS